MSDELRKECEKYGLYGDLIEVLETTEVMYKLIKISQGDKSEMTFLGWIKANVEEAFNDGESNFECLNEKEKFIAGIFTCLTLICKDSL